MLVLDRISFVAASGISTRGVLAVAGVTDEHATLIGTIVGTVMVVATGLAWLDKRMDGKIKRHETAEFEKDEAYRQGREALESERHEGLMREIAHVRELLGAPKKVVNGLHE